MKIIAVGSLIRLKFYIKSKQSENCIFVSAKSD